MTKQTPMSQLPYPEPSDIADVPLHLQSLTQTLDSRTVLRFTDAAARDVAVTQPVAGMLAWLNTPGVYTFYNGSQWAPYLLQDPPFALLQQSAAQDIANLTPTTIVWPTPVADSYTGWSSANPTRYTPKVAGYYHVAAQVPFSVNTTGGRCLNLVKNGSVYFGQVASAVITSTYYFTNINVTATAYFNGTTDYLELQAHQNSGATLQTVAGGPQMTVLRVHS